MDGTSSEPCCDLPWKPGRYPACRQSNSVRAADAAPLVRLLEPVDGDHAIALIFTERESRLIGAEETQTKRRGFRLFPSAGLKVEQDQQTLKSCFEAASVNPVVR